MGARKHHDGKNMSGSHTSVIDPADPILRLIKKIYPDVRIQNGHIIGKAGARAKSVKFSSKDTCILLIVVSKATRQEFRIYGNVNIATIQEALTRDKKIRDYFIS